MNRKIIASILLILFISGCSNQVTEQPSPSQISAVGSISPTSTSQETVIATSTLAQVSISDFGNEALAYALFTPGDIGIFILSPLSGKPNLVIGEQETIVFYDVPSWSPGGERIAFASDRGRGFKIYTIKPDGSDLHQLVMSSLSQHDPAWSPDGENVVFNTDNDLYLYVVNADGSRLRQLVRLPSTPSFPVWSPDGKRIAFIISEGNLIGSKIYLVNADGSNPHPITDAIAGWSKISWSPDGRKIAFRTFAGCGDISILDVKTGGITQLTNTPTVELDPAWSPDGKYIAYASVFYEPCEQNLIGDPYAGGDLYIMRVDGSGATRLMYSQGFEPAWWPVVVLQVNWKYRITHAGLELNVRNTPSLSANSLLKLPEGATFTALEGPIEAEGYQWWRIRTEDDIEGWIVDVPGWYMLESAPVSTGTPMP